MHHLPLRSLTFLAVSGLIPVALWAADDTSGEQPLVLSPVEVTAVADSINPLASPTAGVMGDTRSLLETPRAATTLTPALIREQGIDSIAEIAAQSPGVYAPSSYGLLTTPIIRGDTAETYVNGQRLGFNNYGYLPSFNSVEAIDIVRGPASAVFGSGYLVGGYVNYRTKQPNFDAAHTEITVKAGTWVPGSESSYANGSFQIDHTAPLSETLAYRISYENKGGDTFYKSKGVEDDRQDFFFALAWRPSDTLRVDANAQIFWQNAPETLGVNRVTQELIDKGIYRSGAVAPYSFNQDPVFLATLTPVAIGRNALLFKTGDSSDTWVARTQVAVTSEISPDLLFVNRTLVERVDRERANAFGYQEDVAATVVENRSELKFDFTGFDLDQSVLAGFALRFESRKTYADYSYGDALDSYDVTDPSTIITPPVSYFEQLDEDLLVPSFFWQHEIKLTERLTLLAGLREDLYLGDYSGTNDFVGVPANDRVAVGAFSQAYSLTWTPRDELSLYITHNRMQTQGTNGSAVGGGYYFTKPTVSGDDFRRPSVLTELGAKANLLDGKLFAGLAVFQQERSRDDFASPSDIVVRGVELEATYQPVSGLSLFGNATFQRGHYDNADIYQQGDTVNFVTGPGDWDLVGFSEVMLNGGIRYRLDCGFGAGLSGSWQSEQNVNIATPGYPQITIPAQFQIDATLFYEADDWSASIGFLNVTDERNWIHNGDAYSGGAIISQSLPFRVEATVKVRF